MSVLKQNLVPCGCMIEIHISSGEGQSQILEATHIPCPIGPSSIFEASSCEISLPQDLDLSSFHVFSLTQPGEGSLTPVIRWDPPG